MSSPAISNNLQHSNGVLSNIRWQTYEGAEKINCSLRKISKVVFRAMASEQLTDYKAGKESVRKAVNLFNNVKTSTKRRKSEKDEDKPNRYSQYCNPIVNNKKKLTALAFLPSFAMTEMRLCLMKHDWVNLQRLFPFLLELTSDRETLIWRYALTILLHSPMSSIGHVEEFLNSCIGCQNDNLSHVLNQLITLRKETEK